MLTHQTKLVSVIKHWHQLNNLGIVPIIEERKPNNHSKCKKISQQRQDLTFHILGCHRNCCIALFLVANLCWSDNWCVLVAHCYCLPKQASLHCRSQLWGLINNQFLRNHELNTNRWLAKLILFLNTYQTHKIIRIRIFCQNLSTQDP